MQVPRVIELVQGECLQAVVCPKCGLCMLDREAMGRVQIADAELLFCSNCGTHLASILEREQRQDRLTKGA